MALTKAQKETARWKGMWFVVTINFDQAKKHGIRKKLSNVSYEVGESYVANDESIGKVLNCRLAESYLDAHDEVLKRGEYAPSYVVTAAPEVVATIPATPTPKFSSPHQKLLYQATLAGGTKKEIAARYLELLEEYES